MQKLNREIEQILTLHQIPLPEKREGETLEERAQNLAATVLESNNREAVTRCQVLLDKVYEHIDRADPNLKMLFLERGTCDKPKSNCASQKLDEWQALGSKEAVARRVIKCLKREERSLNLTDLAHLDGLEVFEPVLAFLQNNAALTDSIVNLSLQEKQQVFQFIQKLEELSQGSKSSFLYEGLFDVLKKLPFGSISFGSISTPTAAATESSIVYSIYYKEIKDSPFLKNAILMTELKESKNGEISFSDDEISDKMKDYFSCRSRGFEEEGLDSLLNAFECADFLGNEVDQKKILFCMNSCVKDFSLEEVWDLFKDAPFNRIKTVFGEKIADECTDFLGKEVDIKEILYHIKFRLEFCSLEKMCEIFKEAPFSQFKRVVAERIGVSAKRVPLFNPQRSLENIREFYQKLHGFLGDSSNDFPILIFMNTKISVEFLRKHIDMFPNATQVTLQLCQIDDRNINDIVSQLERLKSLTELNISFNKIGPIGANAVARLKSLCILRISQAGIGPLGAEAVARLEKLHTLDISFNGIGPSGAKAVARLKSLCILRILDNGIGDDGAKAIARLKKLHTLCMSFSEIKPSTLEAIGNLKNLSLKGW